MRYGRALLEVEKPGRYEGLEVGAVVQDWAAARVRVALCFPDVYEIGMSHAGLPVLYHALNRAEGVLAERAYAPWKDMEALLRRRGWPLVTRESGRPLREFDLVGFTLPYELSITNVLLMLDLGGIPLRAADRTEGDPLVVAGGPVAANPEPFAPFFDAVFVGDGEEAVVEMARVLEAAGPDRAARLEALGRVEGVYLPARTRPRFEAGRFAGFEPPVRVRRRVLPDLADAPPPERPLVPFIGTVHDRLSVEVCRGCTRGCRFCQAGFYYRPVRERPAGQVLESVGRGLAETGYDEVGLLSLSTGDYSAIGPLLVRLMAEHAPKRTAVSLPSLRVDSLDDRVLEEIRRVRKTGFTLALEAGTDRLRRVINKNITEAEIFGAVHKVFAAGWKGLKLYFMIGLPTETPEDREAIVELVRRVAQAAPKGRGRVGVSLSTFVPKPHTPFQWARQIGIAETEEIQAFFKERLRRGNVELRWHDARMSLLEGVIARGDRRLADVIEAAYRRGCRMDAWTGEFRWDLWEEAFAEAGLDPEAFLAERDPGAPQPWDVVDLGVDPAFLRGEWERAQRAEPTPDCRDGACQGCGLCDFDEVRPRKSPPAEYPPRAEPPEETEDLSQVPRVRFRFEKMGPASFLAHLETVGALHRALRAAGVDLVYSRGFHPQPRLVLGPALPLGTESRAELADVKVWTVPPLAETQERLNAHLPEGLRVDALWVLGPDAKGLTGGNTREEYEVVPSAEADAAVRDQGGWPARIEGFWAAAGFPVVKRRKNKADRVLDARRFVEGLWADAGRVFVRIRRDENGTAVTPEDLLHTLAGLPDGVRACERIVKVRMRLA
ncbi:TIGR03960 family B12-binding radical SAM protein [Deferrisoma palaeochoriense]